MPTRVRVELAAAIVVLGCVIGFLHWKVETWLDWRLGYGSRVEQKIEVLERRVTELEERNR